MEDAMSVVRWMDANGDTEIVWQKTDTASMGRAREMVNRAFREGRGVFTIDGEGVGTRLHEFDLAASEIVVIPQIKGG